MTNFKIIDESGNIVLNATALKSKTIRGIRAELKKTSFAIKDMWTIRVEELYAKEKE